MVFKKKNQ